jgi:hypothetical protein
VPLYGEPGGRKLWPGFEKRNRSTDRFNARQPIVGLIKKQPLALRKSPESLGASSIDSSAERRIAIGRRQNDEITIRVFRAPAAEKFFAAIVGARFKNNNS